MKILLLVVVFWCSSQSNPAYGNNSKISDRIQAATQFLIEGDNDNCPFYFEHSIGNSKSFEWYFPHALRQAQSGNSKVLSSSHEPWEDAIRADLSTLISTVFARENDQATRVHSGIPNQNSFCWW